MPAVDVASKKDRPQTCLRNNLGYNGSYLDHITTKRAERLEEMGRAKAVRHKKGAVNCPILLRGKDDPHVTTASRP